ncbi:uncharacterized protein [Arachis hypogaea]|uniref:uncharacterized protein n=1 Tax=Arachis hypogaea TaxID=3818 RepID=UPI003B22786B
MVVGHNALLTNVERRRRHLTQAAPCSRCDTNEETCLQVSKGLSICSFRLAISQTTRPRQGFLHCKHFVISDGIGRIKIPDDILIKDWINPVEAVVTSTFKNYIEDPDDEKNLQDRAVLAPTLQTVDEINEYMMKINQRQHVSYFSADMACKSETQTDVAAAVHTSEFLNGLKSSGLPNHEIKLKLGKRIIEAKVITGNNAGQKVFIPRMNLSPSDHRIPFKFNRRQFPIMVSYAMTINKSQGQSLSNVSLLLRKPVFSHGQLYVALSRVTTRQGLKILISNEAGKESTVTDNVVYNKVFRNLD